MPRIAAWALLCLGLVWGSEAFAKGSYPAHRGQSPESFDKFKEPSSTYVVNDTDSDTIDKYLYRNDGPIIINLPIERYLGPVDNEGHLLVAEELIQRGIVGRTATIRLPSFDVDSETFPFEDCDGDRIPDQLMHEVDQVYLNDELLGNLRGEDGSWNSNTFEVPISKLKFPIFPGNTAVNVIKVVIDAANKDVMLSSGARGCEVWAVSIDWVGVSFQASSPVVLVHGIGLLSEAGGAKLADLERGLMDERIYVVDRSVQMNDYPSNGSPPIGCGSNPYNNSVEHNATQLRTQLPGIAERFRSESLHFVAHSKGGLDLRKFLHEAQSSPIQVKVGTMGGQPVKRDLEARSLITLNTPHQGSVLAKIGVERRELRRVRWLKAFGRRPIPYIVMSVLMNAGEAPFLCDLTPEGASAVVRTTQLPNGLQTASVATGADRDGNGKIEGAEAEGFPGRNQFPLVGDLIATGLYKLVGSVSDVDVVVTPGVIWDDLRVDVFPPLKFEPNDTIVTKSSASGYVLLDVDGRNHFNVRSDQVARDIAKAAQQGQRIDWKVK